MSTFWAIAEDYLHANASPTLEQVRTTVARRGVEPRWITFREELRAVLDARSVTAREFERRLDWGFETDEEAYRWLEEVWAYLYEGGPTPR